MIKTTCANTLVLSTAGVHAFFGCQFFLQVQKINYQSYFVVVHFLSFENTDIHTDKRKYEKLINRDIWCVCACKQGKTIFKKKKQASVLRGLFMSGTKVYEWTGLDEGF